MIRYLLLIFCLSLHGIAMAQPVPVMLSMKGFGGDKHDNIYNITTDLDGGPIISINSPSNIGNIQYSCSVDWERTIFRKYSPDGNTIEWDRCITGVIDSTYNYLFSKVTSNYLGGFDWKVRNVLLRKEDKNEAILWTKEYGGSGDDRINNMIPVSDGGFIITGQSNSSNGDVGSHYGSSLAFDSWIFRVDSNGNVIWKRSVGGSLDEKNPKLAIGPANSTYLISTTESNDFDCIGFHGVQDVLLTRLNDTGGIIWSKCFGGTKEENARAILPSKNGGVIIAATTISEDGDLLNCSDNSSFWVTEIDSNGNIVWGDCYGNGMGQVPIEMCYSLDNTIWIVGSKSDGYTDSWIVHLTSNGVLLSSKQITLPNIDRAVSVVPLNSGFIMVGGEYSGTDATIPEFPSTWYGQTDIYVAIFTPWTTGISPTTRIPLNINIYPTPTIDKINIELPENSTGSFSISISNISGTQQYANKITGNNVQLDISEYPSGIYFLNVINKEFSTTKKIIKR